MVQFRVKEIGEKEVRMFFIRNFFVTLIIVYDEDRVLITGMEIGVFQRTAVGGYFLLFPLNFAEKSYIQI